MVTKSKLKMALASERQTDFKKLNLKKKEKASRKGKVVKAGKEIVVGEEEWQDLSSGEEEEEEENDGESEDDGKMKIDFARLDESDSDSSIGDNDQEDDEEEEEDDEDIPMSDLEDLPEEDKEDMIPHQRLTINNTVALTAALKRFALPISKLPFSEHQSVTTAEPVVIADVSDDLNRELAFYAQALSAAQDGRKQLKAEGVAFTRPTDYFAEMIKADEHMAKIKAKLIDEAASKKASAEARKQRDLKKFGKQVQIAKQQERDKEKKQTLEKIKVLKRKRQGGDADKPHEADLFDVALEEETKSTARTSRRDREGGRDGNKRQKKDAKYGHGGKKRFGKSGDAMSSGDLSGFSSKRMKGGAASKRPGKARRAGARK